MVFSDVPSMSCIKVQRMSIQKSKRCLVIGLFLISASNGLPTGSELSTGVSSQDEQSTSREDNTTLSISQNMCLEYSKWTRSQVALSTGSMKSALNLHGKIDQCGISDNSTLSGDAELGEVPHMALIGYERNGEMEYICGGSLISEKYVLTAGYCASEISKSLPYIVRLGGLHLKNLTEDAEIQQIKVAEAIPYPTFVAGEVYNDIALIRLEKAVKLNWYIRPICLHTGAPVHKEPLIAAGWGKVPQTGRRNEMLRKVKLVETPYEVCKVPYDIRKHFGRMVKTGIDNDTMICATHPLGHDGLCAGDGGGPLYIRSVEPYCSYQLVGIVGFGGVCKKIQDVPTVFTRVEPYVQWIEAIVWQHKTSLYVEPLK